MKFKYKLHFVLVIRAYFGKDLIYPDIQTVRIQIKIILTNMFILYQIQQRMYKFLLCIFRFTHSQTKN